MMFSAVTCAQASSTPGQAQSPLSRTDDSGWWAVSDPAAFFVEPDNQWAVSYAGEWGRYLAQSRCNGYGQMRVCDNFAAYGSRLRNTRQYMAQ
jgi:hypothetical protein